MSQESPPALGVAVTGMVRAPAASVWALIKEFGAPTTRWWKNARRVSIDSPGQDIVGCTRTYDSVSGYGYIEKLVERDDRKWLLKYRLQSATPTIPVDGIETTIRLIAHGPHTVVSWSSSVEGADAPTLARIKAAQAKVYSDAIHDLEVHFGAAERLLKALEHLRTDVEQLVQQLGRAERGPIAYETYGRIPWMPEVPLEELPKLARGLPPSELLSPEILGGMFTRQFRYFAAQRGVLDRRDEAASSGADPHAIYFRGPIQVPAHVLDESRSDAELCRQLLQGANPHVIACLHDPSAIPGAFIGRKSEQGETAEQLAAAGRLFVCDYAPLLNVGDPNTIKTVGHFEYHGMVVYAPIMLVYRADGESDLRILGIQLTRHPSGRDQVYTPGSRTPNKYQLAKMHVACADMQVQEWIYHLGLAHLCVEPLAIATRNAFANHQEHPIGRLLAPHFDDTIGINFLARRTLVSYTTPFTDQVFSTGCAGALKMVLAAWKEYDLFGSSFPALLARRGFGFGVDEVLTGYYYRDDAQALWTAIEDYVDEVVTVAYPDEALVAKDAVLTAWAQECASDQRAGVPGFPSPFTDREQLVRTLTTIIHNSSVMHAAVNYTQMDYQAYLPNRSPSLLKTMPVGPDDVSEDYVRGALPGEFVAHFQAMFSYILTLPGRRPLTDLPSPGAQFDAAHQRFQAGLREVGAAIDARNEALVQRRRMPYTYLHPRAVPASVAI